MQTPAQSKVLSLLQRKNESFQLKTLQIKLERLINGRSPREIQVIYIWSVFLTLTAVSILAQIFYPADFSLLSNTISQQGSIHENPIGSIIWRIGVILNGFAHIPHIFYIEHHLKPYNQKKAKFMRNFGIISAISFSLVGLFSIEYGAIHYIAALFAFWGYYFTGNISFNILNRELKEKSTISDNQYRRIRRFSLYFSIYFNISGALCLSSFLINKIFFNKDLWPPVEWNYLIAICVWLLLWPTIVKTLESSK